MKTAYLDVPPKRWGVVVIYDYDVDEEYIDLMAILRSFMMSPYNAKRALEILSSYNTGMTISIDDLRMSVIFVSKTTDESQFWDTLNHELLHVNVAVIDYYNEPYDGEGAAYLQGYLMRQAVKEIGEPCY